MSVLGLLIITIIILSLRKQGPLSINYTLETLTFENRYSGIAAEYSKMLMTNTV